METVRRLDRGEYRKAEKTPEGFLKADGWLTRVGVFPYRLDDGTIFRELRLPEEVFKPESIKSFALMPVTDDHPPEFLTKENAQKYAVGSTGDSLRRDGDYLVGPLSVHADPALGKIDSGKVELSLGYWCDLEKKPGVWTDAAGNKHPYDAIQRNIRGNHVAIVDKGRAGPNARLRLDAAEQVQDERGGTPPEPKEKKMTTVSKKLDGVDCEVTPQVAQIIDRMTSKVDADLSAMKKRADDAETALQKEKGRADQLAADLQKAQDALKEATDPAKVQAKIKDRVDLETKARAVLGADAKLDALDTRGVQVAVLAKLNPKLDLKDQADAYVQGRFDMAIDALGADALAKARQQMHGSPPPAGKTDSDQRADAKAAMVKRETDRWKNAGYAKES